MPFPGQTVRAPIMAARHAMRSLDLGTVTDQGPAPLKPVIADGKSSGANDLAPGSTPAAPRFASLPTLR